MQRFKSLLAGLAVLLSLTATAQELYVFTEPASNMAARSIGLRLNNSLMRESDGSKINYHLIPEIMVGVSRKTMLHGDIFFSNRTNSFSAEGASIYGKYRFLSNDEVQRHFRMAAFSRISFNNSDIHQEEINLYGHNTGYEAGVVATQLLYKVALSSGLSFVKALNNGNGNKFPYKLNDSKAINYTFSVGKLMLPKEYTDYKQTNLNLMLEFLSQFNTGSGKYYIDAAPAVQFIFNSQGRIDVGYREQLRSTLLRTAPGGLFVRLEYNLFNVY
ncbi:MAG: hypothetical protein JWN76_361 [Chitinophagaceae bacterium]|nr:hypothetical protein [Chitinophagaceae bacterium]